MKSTKISLLLISVSMSTLIFTGCGRSNSMKTPMDNTYRTNQTNKSNQATSTDKMKTIYSNALNELVTAKTITATQSKKVFTAITKNMSQDSVTNISNGTTTNREATGTPEMTGTPGATGSTGTSAETGTGTPGITGTGTIYSTDQNDVTTNNTNVTNELDLLVRSKVITKGQKDMIYQKIRL